MCTGINIFLQMCRTVSLTQRHHLQWTHPTRLRVQAASRAKQRVRHHRAVLVKGRLTWHVSARGCYGVIYKACHAPSHRLYGVENDLVFFMNVFRYFQYFNSLLICVVSVAVSQIKNYLFKTSHSGILINTSPASWAIYVRCTDVYISISKEMKKVHRDELWSHKTNERNTYL